jgi:hypothetical protein
MRTPDQFKTIPLWPLPAVRDLTRDGRLSTYDGSVLKLSMVSFRGKCARMGHPLKLPSPKKLARLGHFPSASQAGRLAYPQTDHHFFHKLFDTHMVTHTKLNRELHNIIDK